MTLSSPLIRLTFAQQQPAVEILSRAFLTYPMMTAILPDEARRARFVAVFAKKMMNFTLRYGEAYTDAERKGAALWLLPGQTGVTPWRILRSGMLALVSTLNPGEARKFLSLLAYEDRLQHRVVSGLHWYLWLIGVEPTCQRQGVGGKLLVPVLERASQNGELIYLETHAHENVHFYSKYGFEVVSDGEAPRLGVRVWGMLRKP